MEPYLTATLLVGPNFHCLLVAILTGFHCTCDKKWNGKYFKLFSTLFLVNRNFIARKSLLANIERVHLRVPKGCKNEDSFIWFPNTYLTLTLTFLHRKLLGLMTWRTSINVLPEVKVNYSYKYIIKNVNVYSELTWVAINQEFHIFSHSGCIYI